MTLISTERHSTWAQLFGRAYLGTVVVIAGGIAAFATNNYLTASLLPSVLADIGGQRYYAWTTTAFLVASVFAAMLVSRLLRTRGTRAGMLIGLSVFAVGSLLCSLSVSIWMLVLARLVQGFGGGLMSGLALVVMRIALPERLWPPMLALISLMWGVGNLAGPALGGAFAQIHQWRLGFAVMVVAAVAMTVVAVRSLPRARPDESSEPLPVGSLALMTLAALAVSIAATVSKGAPTLIVILAGAALVAAFLIRERCAANGILPRLMFQSGSPLRWCYVGVAGITVGLTIETFVPLFGQRLSGLSPLAAGFLGAALSAGWAVSQLMSAHASGERTTRALRLAGPVLLTWGLAATAALQRSHASPAVIGAWAATMMIAGSGIGISFSRFAFPVMAGTDESDEANKAAAALQIVQTITTAFASALGGVLVNLGEPSMVHAAQLLYGGVAMLSLFGVLAAVRLRQAG